MDNKTNLIYNGNLKYGSDKWNVNGTTFTLDMSDSVNGSYGAFVFSGSAYYGGVTSPVPIPVDTGKTYTTIADVKKDNISGTSQNLFCIYSYDKYDNLVNYHEVGHTGNTTLARDLKDGDTIVYLTSVAGWYNTQTYRYIGICESEAWGYNRTIFHQYYDSSSINTTNNTIALRSGTVWTGGTWSAGTKVACFTDGGTFIYPISVAKSDSNEWHLRSGNTTPSTWRTGTDHIRPGMICYKDNAFRIANWSLIGQDIYQTRKAQAGEGKNSIKKTGVVENSNNMETSSMKVRYIRDWLSGSTANSNNHWVEIRAFDIYGRNVAVASNGSAVTEGGTSVSASVIRSAPNCSSNPNYPKFHTITRGGSGAPPTSPYLQTPSNVSKSAVVIDLGYEHELVSIQVWHYWGDGRTYYGTKTEVSTDGQNWKTVFDSETGGRYAESSGGHVINLGEFSIMSMTSGGEYHSNSFYEI